MSEGRVLVHLAAGIGNIVLATPLLVELDDRNWQVDLWISADYGEAASLFDGWCVVDKVFQDPLPPSQLQEYDLLIPAVPPFYWPRFSAIYSEQKNTAARPPDELFYQNEQKYYKEFAINQNDRRTGSTVYRLPIAMVTDHPVSFRTLTIAPGCKTGEMSAKRWPFFVELAKRFDDVALVGTKDDLRGWDNEPLHFPDYVKNLVGLSLRQTAEVLASSGVVVGNDSGLSHIAAAVGTPVVMLFGPTPHLTLGEFPPNVIVVRAGMACEPCWFADRLAACDRRVDCLKSISVDEVAARVAEILGVPNSTRAKSQ